MLVRELATMNPKTVESTASIRDVLTLLREHDFRHVPIVDEAGSIHGIVSETDLVGSASMARRFGQERQAYETFLDASVRELLKTRMTEQEGLATVGPDDDVEEAVQLILSRTVSALPVVDDRQLVGIISYVDILEQLLESSQDLTV